MKNQMNKIINLILITALMVSATVIIRKDSAILLQGTLITRQEELISRQEQYIAGIEGLLAKKYQREVTITAYTASCWETDETPDRTALMTSPRAGIVAVSRDLFQDGWTFGKRVYISGHGIFTIGDLMARRHTESIDIFVHKRQEALQMGRSTARAVLIYEEGVRIKG
jgi:3D (Asp-Asp-Asp) domain-containing protein